MIAILLSIIVIQNLFIINAIDKSFKQTLRENVIHKMKRVIPTRKRPAYIPHKDESKILDGIIQPSFD